MKGLLAVALFFLVSVTNAQVRLANYIVDNTAYATTSTDTLSQLLTADAKTEMEKVRAIFFWIVNNIDYNTNVFYQNRYVRKGNKDEEEYDTSSVLPSLDERVSRLVLKRKVAVCDGYARLFKTLCEHAGITSEVITGYAKTNMNRVGQRFISNHKWNAVMIDSNWYLLDATWAAGYINGHNEFERQYDANYFLPSPKTFIWDHYPEDVKWALLPEPPSLAEYNRTPFKTSEFSHSTILSFKPEKGLVEASPGDSILFEVESTDRIKRLWISSDPYLDSSSLFQFDCWEYLERPSSGSKVSAVFVIEPQTEWLNVVYNDRVIMRYKVNVKGVAAPETDDTKDGKRKTPMKALTGSN
ncbi:transglutaminase domain-containing protein [Danxiaibacter flavus]|uniref:Transglutaminase domain-containing protein n=1 Tax=Danxiaibacter flavus TaxID=3049108 RepID=A0ABV3ZDG6_9BACT|nr:transglutaminase domain-containing protein [Chitinophagaceae bacterium DXS]